jgi:cytochrome c556
MNRMKITAGIILAATALLPSPSPAHEGATGVVKERMDAMTQAGKAVKDAGERIRAGHDLSAIKQDAQVIATVTAGIGNQFPAGSDQHPTDAKPEIWTHWDDFAARAQALERESAVLENVADTGDTGAVGRQFHTVGRICADCHDLYRVKRQ